MKILFFLIICFLSRYLSLKTTKYYKYAKSADAVVIPIVRTNIDQEFMEINKREFTFKLAQKKKKYLSFCDQGSVHEGLVPLFCSLLPRLHHQVHPELCKASEQTLDAAEDPAFGLR